ncbi:MAG: DUF6502 family protein [Gammaproteobacteria bacterium]|nr:DUF6502 family protein [Gammaproteobacteria bacterium]
MRDAKATATAALRLLFRPIARIMLRAGVNWRELADICKATYVEVATEDFGIRGRPTNISRVAILTGLTRREVRRLRTLLQEESPEIFNRMNYATRVLSGWHLDEEFLQPDGKPVPLAHSGEAQSFEALCNKYSGDVAATTMLKELKHVGAVEESEDGTLTAKTRYYMPAAMDPERMLSSGSVLEDIGYTVAYNLQRKDEEPGRFDRRATNTRMPASAIPEFREFLNKEGQAFLEVVDAWLSEHEIDDGDDEEGVRLGLGAYWIEGRKREE